MDQSFWNARYTENISVYGYNPNQFFKQFIDYHQPGRILLPAEGEGRNAVYAASRGWLVNAFDFSEIARHKALQFAESRGVAINYSLMNVADFTTIEQYDAIGLIYVHLPEGIRKRFHAEVYKSLKPGGFIVLEGFAKEQLQFKSGGPKDVTMLYNASSICNDFEFMHIVTCSQKEIILEEGEFHKGKAAVIQLIAQKH